MPKPLTVCSTTNYGKFLKRWEYQTILSASWETNLQVKKQQLDPGMEQWTGSKLGKEYVKAPFVLSPYLFIFSAEYIIWNARLDESQAGIKIAGRSINNLRYAGDTTNIMTVEEPPDEGEKEGEKAGLKLNIQKTKIMASNPFTSWQIDYEKIETVADLIFLVSKIPVDGDCSYEIRRCLLLGREAMTNLDSILKSS